MWNPTVILLLAWAGICSAQSGPLYDYVNRYDPAYSWGVIAQYEQQGLTTYTINMTSQRWFDETFSNRPIWWHYLVVHVPTNLNPDYQGHALVYVSTGNNNEGVADLNTRHVAETGNYANNTGMVTAVLRQIPNQPTLFNGAVVEKSEDGSIAFLWKEYLLKWPADPNTDPEILLRFPMCKAVSRAMDTVTDFVKGMYPVVDIQKYMIAGESKRGWTTWLMPAVDSRVEAMAPVVLSCLNMNTNMHHYWKSMGNWTFMFTDYWLERIPEYIDSPEVFALLDLVDPYSYRQLLTVPKLMVSGASDEFFFPDDYDYFYDDLVGDKFIWLLENTGHSVSRGPLNDAFWAMLETFYISVIKGYAWPRFSWDRSTAPNGDGTIQVTLHDPVQSAEVWVTDTPQTVSPRRDFRLEMLSNGEVTNTNIVWYLFNATSQGPNHLHVTVPKPDTGYRAFFVKLTFPFTDPGRTLTFTTQAQILSFDETTEFPYDDCTGVDCQGRLV